MSNESNLSRLLHIEDNARDRVHEADVQAQQLVDQAQEDANRLVEQARAEAEDEAHTLRERARAETERRVRELLDDAQADIPAERALPEQAKQNVHEAVALLVAWVTTEEV